MDAAIRTRTRLSRADRMEQTLEVAHALFAERGYAAVTMDEIAAAVGVTKPLLYNYFGNKERLYIACMERAGDSLTATIAETVADSANPGDALGAGVRAFFAFLDTDRAAWAVLFDETLPRSGEVADRVADYRGRIVELVSGSLLAQLPAATPRRRPDRGRGPLHRPARRRRGARPLVAADRGDQRRGGGRAPDLDDRARPARPLRPPSTSKPRKGTDPR